MTLDELAYDLWLTIRDGKISDDDELDIRQIKFWIHNNRATWVRNDLSKNRPIPPIFVQKARTSGWNYMELEYVDNSLVPTIPIGCKVLRTVEKIPALLDYNGQLLLTRVGPAVLNSGTFTRIPYERLPYIGTGRFNSQTIYTFWYDYHIYLVSHSPSIQYNGIKKVSIEGIFANPTEVPGYLDIEDYPISAQLVAYLKDIIIKSDVSAFLNNLSDTINNDRDDTIKESKNE